MLEAAPQAWKKKNTAIIEIKIAFMGVICTELGSPLTKNKWQNSFFIIKFSLICKQKETHSVSPFNSSKNQH